MPMRVLLVTLRIAAFVQLGAAHNHLISGVKFRACDGFPANTLYITGADAGDYVASWATNSSQSPWLNRGADLEDACLLLVPPGHVGEIFILSEENQGPDCDRNCYRMAIYPEIQDGKLVGYVEGDADNWVCGSVGMPPLPRPDCPMTCGDVKAAYKASKCCGMPENPFDAAASRRLLGSHGVSDNAALLHDIRRALAQANARSPAKARALEERLLNIARAFPGAGA